jgi:hypothetical protein
MIRDGADDFADRAAVASVLEAVAANVCKAAPGGSMHD